MANKVVSFRINETLFEQIDKAKRSTGASYADLIKRGASICIQEIQSKLDEINRLSERASRLRELIDNREEELNKTIEQERAERQEQLDTEFHNKRNIQEDKLKAARSKLFTVMDEVASQKSDLVKLQKETENQRIERDKVSKQLVQYQQKHGENQMALTTMMLAMMGIAGNMIPSPSQGSDVTSQKKEGGTQQSKPGNYDYLEQSQQSTPSFTSMITGLIPFFSLFMVMSMMAAVTRPPKKKPPTSRTEAEPSALADFIKRSEEHQKEIEEERRKAKPELPDEHKASDDEEEDEEDTTEDEELEAETED